MRYIVAYSGGLDSTCLLHMLGEGHLPPLEYPVESASILVVHVNHGLSPHALQWQQHCARYCQQLNLEFKAIEITLDKDSKKSLEAQARNLRYAALASLMTAGDVLLTAHHLDDQAETFLLQALRGAGVKGLAAMPDKKSFANGELWRPLLSVTRQQLLNYATQQKLSWIEDESNLQCEYSRNFLRQQIFPLLKEHWPSVAKSLAQASDYCADADELCQALATIDAQVCITERQTMAIERLLALSVVRQKNVLRFWLKQQNFTVPSGKILQRILHEAIPAACDATPIITWEGGEIRRFKQELYALSFSQVDTDLTSIEWLWSRPLELVDQRLAMKLARPGLSTTELAERLHVEFRYAGETVKLWGHKQRKSLKKLLQQWQVPPWERSTLALIFSNGTLIAAPPYYQAVSKSKEEPQYRCYVVKG